MNQLFCPRKPFNLENPMETPDPPSDTPGASKQVLVFLTPQDIPYGFLGKLNIKFVNQLSVPKTGGFVVATLPTRCSVGQWSIASP